MMGVSFVQVCIDCHFDPLKLMGNESKFATKLVICGCLWLAWECNYVKVEKPN